MTKPSSIDIYLPGKGKVMGGLHPLTQIAHEIIDFLGFLGYQFVEAPEIETKENNFDYLNIPVDHPDRSLKDTFYFNQQLLLRTHTSNTQIRILKKYSGKSLKVVTVGKVYRREVTDSTHTPQFTQVECFAVSKQISFSHLKGTLVFLLRKMFGVDSIYRFRPSYFAFTRLSVEVDLKCSKCIINIDSKCSVCKNTGWLEVLGAGLIHSDVLKNCGYDSDKFTGLAFGLGLERFAMIKYGIEDIRHFYNNDWDFLKQFASVSSF